jgi:hypothetical protein
VVVADADHDQAEQLADLRARKAKTISGVHGFGHVVEQAAGGIVDASNPTAYALEHGVLSGKNP